MQRSPARRSPRLQQEDSAGAPTTSNAQPQPVTSQSMSAPSSATATSTKAKGTKPPDSGNQSTPTRAGNVPEMQKEIAVLKRQLSDTQSQLENKNQMYQQLHLAYKSSSSSSSQSLSLPPSPKSQSTSVVNSTASASSSSEPITTASHVSNSNLTKSTTNSSTGYVCAANSTYPPLLSAVDNSYTAAMPLSLPRVPATMVTISPTQAANAVYNTNILAMPLPSNAALPARGVAITTQAANAVNSTSIYQMPLPSHAVQSANSVAMSSTQAANAAINCNPYQMPLPSRVQSVNSVAMPSTQAAIAAINYNPHTMPLPSNAAPSANSVAMPLTQAAIAATNNNSYTVPLSSHAVYQDSSVAMPTTQAVNTANHNGHTMPMPSHAGLSASSVAMSTTPAVNAANIYHAYTMSLPSHVSPPSCSTLYAQPSPLQNNLSGSTNPRKLQDLPQFSGQPEDWPIFYTAFIQSTVAYNYTNLENNQRLIKCLKGEALAVIKSLLIHPDNVNAAIEQLQFRFGRPEQLIQSQLRQVRELPVISEGHIAKLVPFSTKVKNLAVFLRSVNGQQHIANPTLLEELVLKLPMSKKLEWARVAATIKPYPTIIHFSDWISEVANLICTVQDVEYAVQKRRVLLNATEKQQRCQICQGQHKIYECSRFLKSSVSERWSLIKKLHACFSCLNIGHGARECKRKRTCPQNGCQRKHHQLLHENARNEEPLETPSDVSETRQNVLSCTAEPDNNKLLFRILPVTLFGDNCRMDTYALFDDGSSITMLDKDVADKLGVRGKEARLNIQWFGGRSAVENVSSFNIKIRGMGKSKSHVLRNVYAVSNLNLPKQSLTKSDIEIGFKSSSAPVKPYSNVVPQLLIGLDHAHLGLPTSSKLCKASGPIACNTKLGWVVYGPCRTLSQNQIACLFANVNNDNSLHQMVNNYFNIESIGVRSAPLVESQDDIRAKKLLEETTKRVGDRFQTGLLWKSDKVVFPNNYAMALKRLDGIERKMYRSENFAIAYKEVIQDYIEKGYVRKVSHEEANIASDKKWYLPHFGVVNLNKPKKIRLVFDAAAQSDGTSLNSHLLKGPQDIALLPNILFNFRRGKVAVYADIRQMYHQIFIRPEDRISQRFLWRDGNRNKPPDEYEMVVMSFGAACSPCSARYVLKVNAKDHNNCHPRALEAIMKHHYIDDYIDSFETAEEAIHISAMVRNIHKNGGFDLRGFTSNSNEVNTALDGNIVPRDMLSNEGTEKVLGVYWDCSSDNFKFHLKFHRVDSSVISGQRKPTKRELLSIIMSTYDPLGFLSMYTVCGKLVLREVWRRDCRWDEEIPDDISDSWERWRRQMGKVEEFRIPRCYFAFGPPHNLQLHIFVDASEDAFGAVAYWRYIALDETTHVSFIASKTKCAPLKFVTIPRLELQAAVVGTRLKQSILEGHNFSPEKCVLWSDSKTVIKWISSSHRRYKPYVAHRVAEILSSTETSDWRWISSKDNAADDATRPSNNVNFSPNSRWLLGPDFLRINEDEWFNDCTPGGEGDDDEEILRPKTCLLLVSNLVIDYTNFSSLLRIKRIFAWVLRYIRHCRGIKGSSIYGLTAEELEAAEKLLILRAQAEKYSEEILCIRNSTAIPKNSHLFKLLPYVDEDGLLRVYGRIDAASFLPYSSRRPIILPNDHHFAKLVVLHCHCQMKHQNHEASICEIRKRFWIPHIRRLLKKVISNCMVCRQNKATPQIPTMGPLPKDRLEPYTRPFKNTGIDYFGPFTVSIGRRLEKRWVALFTCLTVRAVHLELAYDLSTDSCIIAMKNFMNRRGVPARIRSDNGTNFVGANEEAKRFCDVFEGERIQDELSARGVEWIFNCPNNPSEGGVWERMVQCVKRVLRQTLKDISPKEHVLQSLLIEAENIVNSRPLTHLPVSSEEEEPLTPNHFLIGYGNVAQTPAVREPEDKLYSLRKQWRIAKGLRDRFWKRWVLEYLPTLTRRVKWCKRAMPVKEGDLVLICDPNLPRCQWRRGIVVRVYTGVDGVIRRADIKTNAGVLQRAVSKLAVLDLENGEASRSTGEGVLRNAL